LSSSLWPSVQKQWCWTIYTGFGATNATTQTYFTRKALVIFSMHYHRMVLWWKTLATEITHLPLKVFCFQNFSKLVWLQHMPPEFYIQCTRLLNSKRLLSVYTGSAILGVKKNSHVVGRAPWKVMLDPKMKKTNKQKPLEKYEKSNSARLFHFLNLLQVFCYVQVYLHSYVCFHVWQSYFDTFWQLYSNLLCFI